MSHMCISTKVNFFDFWFQFFEFQIRIEHSKIYQEKMKNILGPKIEYGRNVALNR